MVYETKTLKACHQLSQIGKLHYEELLEREADDILFRHEHPVKWLISKMTALIKG